MADAPENSLQAFRNALDHGATGLESDVWLDAAQVPVLHHGPPDRLREPPLALAELFEACGTGFDLSLDMRGPGAAARTVEVARAAGFDLSRLWLVGGRGSCVAWRGLDPRLRLVTDLRWQDAWRRPDEAMRVIAAEGIDAVNLRQGRWSRRLVDRAHLVGLRAFAWDVNTRCHLRRAVRRGVDGVYSDHVRLLQELSAGATTPR
jgi:glycerophosphoryl diester phosphodiesterase